MALPGRKPARYWRGADLSALRDSIEDLQTATGYDPRAYYADSVRGDDGNAGMDPTSPLKTIAALVAADAAAPRSTWLLAAGSHWREAITVPRDDMTVAAYGEGDKPLLDCSEPVTASAWSKTGGAAAVYQATVALDVAGAVGTLWVSAWESGARLVRASSVANCDATAGSYYPSADGAASITLYVHASDGSDPGTSGKVYEYSRRQSGVDSRAVLRAKLVGLWTRRNLQNDGSLIIGKYGLAKDCLATEGSKHAVYNRTGSTLVNVEARDRYYPTLADSLFVFNEDSPAGEGVVYRNCWAHSTVPDATADGFYGHTNVSGTFGSVTYQSCTAENLRYGLLVDPVAWPTYVKGGTFRSNAEHIKTYGNLTVTGPVTMKGGTSYNVSIAQANVAVSIDGLTTDGATIFGSATGQALTLTNSTLGPNAIPIQMNAAGATVDLSGNTIGLVTGQYIYVAGPGSTLTSNGNRFTDPASRGGLAFHLNGAYYSWAGWQAIPQDAASVSIASLALPTFGAPAYPERARLTAAATWDPASVAAGAYTSTTLSVPGAAIGDTVAVGFSRAVPAGCLLMGAVTAADTVTVTLMNHTAGAVDLASGTLRADVWPH